jgi:magnesium transporter
MLWHAISDPQAPELDQLAEKYRLHAVHVTDCRAAAQRAKVEAADHYLFIVLKILFLETNHRLAVGDLSLFVGADFLITVQLYFCAGRRGFAPRKRRSSSPTKCSTG